MRTLPPKLWRLLPIALGATLLALPISAGAATRRQANAPLEQGLACLKAHGVEPGLTSTSDASVKAAAQACSSYLPSPPDATKLPPPRTIDPATLPAEMQRGIGCLKAHGIDPTVGSLSSDKANAEAALQACSAYLPSVPSSDAVLGPTNGD